MAAAAPGVLGIAPHSGWAAAVVLAGTRAAPRVVLRETLELCDPRLPGSKQPYHALEALPLGQAERALGRFSASAARLAGEALQRLLAHLEPAGITLRAAGILDASGRHGTTLAAILASHALIHCADGDHFRAALAAACEQRGLPVERVPRGDLTPRAAAALRTSAPRLEAAVKALGRDLGAPWGADQKSAALLAWLLLPEWL